MSPCAAAGMADGAYRIGPLEVDVSDGVAHLAWTEVVDGAPLLRGARVDPR